MTQKMEDSKPARVFKAAQLEVRVYLDEQALGRAAAREAARTLNNAVKVRGEASVILATGNSQLAFLEALRTLDVPWDKVRIFHMDEYLELPASHSASFRQFLQRELTSHVSPLAFYGFETDSGDAEAIVRSYQALLERYPPDLCCMGIGENGHLAFNDPPFADFNDSALLKRVELDTISRQQQVREGHFACLEDVPTHAITLTIPALLRPARVLVIVPELRKAEAVQKALEGSVTPDVPASILQRAPQATLLLDADAASLLAE